MAWSPNFGNASPKILFQVKKRLDGVVFRCQEEGLGLRSIVVGHAHRDRWYGLGNLHRLVQAYWEFHEFHYALWHKVHRPRLPTKLGSSAFPVGRICD